MIRSCWTLQDVVLLGGGHPHVEVIRRFGMLPIPGVRFTLIAASSATPYRCSECHNRRSIKTAHTWQYLCSFSSQ
jgi:pyruvate-formate lyase-activating enzyme